MKGTVDINNILQIIRGKLEREGLQYDEIVVLEEDELKVGNTSTFNVRLIYGGYQKNLGLWKINVMQGDITEIFKSKESLNESYTFDQYRKILKIIKDEMNVQISKFYEPLAQMINKFSAENIKSAEQLLYPKNYIRMAINSSIQKLYKSYFGLPYAKEALEKLKNNMINLNDNFNINEMNEAEQAINRLAFYCAAVKDEPKVSESDVDEATIFYQFVLECNREKFSIGNQSVPIKNVSNLFHAFTEWKPFKRLPPRLKNESKLISLLIDFARVHYVFDNFTFPLDQSLRKYIERLNE